MVEGPEEEAIKRKASESASRRAYHPLGRERAQADAGGGLVPSWLKPEKFGAQRDNQCPV
jgi:hypothetical protein